MASFDINNPNVRSIIFVKIELNGLTLRYATENITAKDTDNVSYFWEGRVLSLSDLSSGFNDFRDSQTIVSSMDITLANGKDYSSASTLDAYISSYFWGNRAVTVSMAIASQTSSTLTGPSYSNWMVGAGQFMGPGKYMGALTRSVTSSDFSLSTTDIIFKGIISFPNVFTEHSDTVVSFSAFDDRYRDQLRVAKNVFLPGVFDPSDVVTDFSPLDSLQSNVEGQNIPVIYGDFSDAANVPCFGINGFPYSLALIYQVADSESCVAGQDALTSVQNIVIKDITRYNYTSTAAQLTEGVVVITNFSDISSSFDPDKTSVFVSCKGKTRGTAITAIFGGSASTCLEHPIEVLYDLLVNLLGVSSSQIDTTSFIATRALDTSLVCRRWIGADETVVQVLNDLCFEFGFDLYSLVGKFYISRQALNFASSLSLNQDHLDPQTYHLETDPNRAYFNKLQCQFLTVPQSSAYSRAASIRNDLAIVKHGLTQPLNLELNWNYEEAQIIDRFGYLLYFFSKPIRTITANFRSIAWNLLPSQVFDFTYHIFTSQNFLIRNVYKSLHTLGTQITGWDLGTLRIKDWAANAATTPTTYADALADTFAIYHGENEIILGFNDTLSITTDATYAVTIPAGVYYLVADLISAIQTAINALSVARPVTISYNSSTRKFTIATNGVTNFTLAWTTTPEIGRSIFGFDVSSNSSGAATYTSTYVTVFEIVDGDLVSQWA